MSSFTPIGLAGTPPMQIGGLDASKHSEGVKLDQVAKSQDKLKFALVDSGMGGGMTAAFLKGEVRQLGSYFCLPIGDKKPAIAEAYTAAMALWPLVMPLANERGENDGHIVEDVIIACNSASVRKENAIGLMADFCIAVQNDPQNEMKLSADVLDGVRKLLEKCPKEGPLPSKGELTTHFDRHVHEIVSKTAEAGVEKILIELKERPSTFVRIDSTNGTAGSKAYPDRMEKVLGGSKGVSDLKRTSFENEVPKDSTHKITHDIFTFTLDGQEKTVVIEGRGNPPWVPDIEANKVSDTGPHLAKTSFVESGKAIQSVLAQEIPDSARSLLGPIPNPSLSMLCCTHYPAMKESLDTLYEGKATFINQATIVEEMAKSIDGHSTELERGDLNLVLTIGSQNYGGTPGELKPSIKDGNATAKTLKTVLDMTLGGNELGLNEARKVGSVQVFQQGEPRPKNPAQVEFSVSTGPLQQQFELIHTFIGRPNAERIYSEQSLSKVSGVPSDKPSLVYKQQETGGDTRAKPQVDKLNGTGRKIFDELPGAVVDKFDQLGILTTLGEARGIDKIAPLNDQGSQLRAATAQLMSVIAANKKIDEIGDRDRVGILTGFSVVDNASRLRKGGENDGPPGAVVMALTIVAQNTPVTLITDRSAEPSLISALIGAGLAKAESESIVPPDQRTLADVVLHDLVKVMVPKADNLNTKLEVLESDQRDANKVRQDTERVAVLKTAEALKNDKITTMISIERPSVTQEDGGLYSMLGFDVSPFNLDMSPLLGTPDFKPFTIGIGDGGNELGTGGIRHMTADGRDENLQPFVKAGTFIGAKSELATDVMLLSTVSNNGGVTVAMALDTALAHFDIDEMAPRKPDLEKLGVQLGATTSAYNDIVGHMFKEELSIDGVNKENLLTVDGRRLGSVEQAEVRFKEFGEKSQPVPLGVGPTGKEGADNDTTHNDTFLKFKHTLLGTAQ